MIHLLALGGAETFRVIGVGEGEVITRSRSGSIEGKAAVGIYADLVWGKDAIVVGIGIAALTHKAAPLRRVRAFKHSREGTALESEGALCAHAHKASMVGIAVEGGVDSDVTLAVDEGAVALPVTAHKAGGVFVAGVDGARHPQVLEGRVLGRAEQGTALAGDRPIDGNGVPLPVEGALEAFGHIVARANHRHSRGDVLVKIDGFAFVGTA